MTEQEKEIEGLWIPKEVWLDTRLSANEKFYLALYLRYSKNESKADRMMAQLASKPTICSIKKTLRKLGLMDMVTDCEQAKELVLQRKGQGEKCEWCGTKTFALQQHHYPIPRSKGGNKTVSICPNCHSEYHLILKDSEEE